MDFGAEGCGNSPEFLIRRKDSSGKRMKCGNPCRAPHASAPLDRRVAVVQSAHLRGVLIARQEPTEAVVKKLVEQSPLDIEATAKAVSEQIDRSLMNGAARPTGSE